jgi:hypothetical protein
MKRKTTLYSLLLFLLASAPGALQAFTNSLSDTCAVNDIVETAIPIDSVIVLEDFVCVEGCTVGATPEVFNNHCQQGLFPTVWYRVFAEDATLINIHVSSNDMETPAFSLYRVLPNSSVIIETSVTQGNLPCVIGTNGVAEATGTEISPNRTYLIAVSSYDDIGGTFSLCVSTGYIDAICVTSRELSVEARSAGGDLSGPFKPGETVSICMNVNSYNGGANGCQWFQGLVPVFGNGWDPSSFDANGQPLNATINGNPMGVQDNGLYGVATWDWFADVDYHYSNLTRQVGDFDGNGTVDMCSNDYEYDCPDLGGLYGACCGPCWDSQIGTLLPPGWFAYGINGSCGAPGPPIRLDWGDGNTCGDGMGPWEFCFDLVVRAYPDCLEDETNRDLTLGFFTFADGEIGSWTGAASICSLDLPVKVSFPLLCNQETDIGIELAEDICSDNVFDYIIEEPGIEHWTWSIFPSWAVQHSAREGENGFAIYDTLINSFSDPVEVTYFFTGYKEGSTETVIKQVRFNILPAIQTSLPGLIKVCERDKDSIVLSAQPVSGGLPPFQYLWTPGGHTTSSITLFPPFQSSAFTLDIIDSLGCTYHRDIQLQIRPCQLDTIMMDDESNDTHTNDDGPINGGKVTFHDPGFKPSVISKPVAIKIFPQPATDLVNIEWTDFADDVLEIIILDAKGSIVYKSTLSTSARKDHRVQVHLGHYARGVYMVMLKTSKTMFTGRMVKMY